MLSFFFLSNIYAATPNAANSGLDLIIILACMALLIGIVYLLKYIFEKFRNPENKTVATNNTTTDAIEKGEI